MNELHRLIIAASGFASIIGFAWIALAMHAHWQRVKPSAPLPPVRQRRLRLQGSLSLALSLALCLSAEETGMAILLWAMYISLGAISVALALAWHPRGLRFLLPADTD